MENKDAILRRIQKLLAIAQDDRANPNEAAAAAGMAERIMRKYQLENADVLAASLKIGDDLSTEDVVATAKTNGTATKVVPPWVQFMASAIARLNECDAKAVRIGRDIGLRFYGYSGDVLVSKWMLEYLVATTNRLCNEFKKTDHYAAVGRASVNSYRKGVSMGILSSLNALIAQKERERQAEVATGTALVVVKKQAIAEKFGTFKYPEKVVSSADGSAFRKGNADGKKVDVSRRAVGETRNSTQLLK
jgi:hypothetical protein